MNDKNRIQVIIPAILREQYLAEVKKTGRGESGLAKYIITQYLESVNRTKIVDFNPIP